MSLTNPTARSAVSVTTFITVSAIALAAATAAPVMAQDSTTDFALEDIIVSAGLTPIAAARYGRAATVLTAQDIADRGLTTVQDALRAVPGVSVNANGHSFTQVRIRGGEANHTLILIDGVRAAGGDAAYVLSGLETANIARIEVLRGPQSVAYGSDASAGVINIITRKSEGSGFSYGGKVEGGAGWSASGYLAYRGAQGGVALGFARMQDRGWDYSGSGGERDGIFRRTLTLSGDHAVAEGLTLGFTYRRSEEDGDTDATALVATGPGDYVLDDPAAQTVREEEGGQIYADYTTPDGRLSARLGLERTRLTQEINSGAPTDQDSRATRLRLSYGLDGPVATGAQVLSLLLEDEHDSSTANPGYDRDTRSVALEYRGTFDSGLDVQIGARYDDNSVFGNAVTWNAAAAYTLDNGARLHASAGAGVVNPSYFELFANAWGYVGNPDLDPERNRSVDLGVELPLGRGVVDVTLFQERLEDEITAVATGPGSYSYVNQSGTSLRRGVEVSGRYDATDQLALRLGYTLLDATNPDGSVEIRRPRHQLSLGATWTSADGRTTLDAQALHVAGNADTQFWGSYATKELPSYWTVDLAGSRRIGDNLRLTARVDNLFDAAHSDAWGYAGRGRTAYVGLGADW
ncbi:TonB-dependent receptor plug domain-containing protein [Pseudooceanicola aestuarii]|uniref:TonB-dependent receptor plug domain-containing protein n=1 Tax=Pseudooceanicola aestuarii TaxID=2697319 RepID=UPI0013D488DB|nr:TonB-dependent receptor [Pseudooceanicola aestuarii]